MNMERQQLKYLPSNATRGALGFASLAVMTIGACLAWGVGVGMFVFGLVFYIDLSADEAIERFTNITRKDEGS